MPKETAKWMIVGGLLLCSPAFLCAQPQGPGKPGKGKPPFAAPSGKGNQNEPGGSGGQGGPRHPMPPKEIVEKGIQNFLDKNKDGGYTSEKDDQGRTIVKDKDGNTVPLQKILPPPPKSMGGEEGGSGESGSGEPGSGRQAGPGGKGPQAGKMPSPEQIEKGIQDFLDKNKDGGYTSEKDDKGRTIVKDKDGKIVPIQKILPPPEGKGKKGPGRLSKEMVEKAIKDFLEKNKDGGYTSEIDSQGRTVVKDKDGKIVPLEKILPLPPKGAGTEPQTGTTQAASGTIVTTTTSTESTSTETSSEQSPQNPDEAMDTANTESSTTTASSTESSGE